MKRNHGTSRHAILDSPSQFLFSFRTWIRKQLLFSPEFAILEGWARNRLQSKVFGGICTNPQTWTEICLFLTPPKHGVFHLQGPTSGRSTGRHSHLQCPQKRVFCAFIAHDPQLKQNYPLFLKKVSEIASAIQQRTISKTPILALLTNTMPPKIAVAGPCTKRCKNTHLTATAHNRPILESMNGPILVSSHCQK